MHKGFRRSSDFATIVAVAAFVLGYWLLVYRAVDESSLAVGAASIVFGAACLFLAFAFYVRAKGYPTWWCLLFFIAGPVAFWIFWILPDRMITPASSPSPAP